MDLYAERLHLLEGLDDVKRVSSLYQGLPCYESRGLVFGVRISNFVMPTHHHISWCLVSIEHQKPLAYIEQHHSEPLADLIEPFSKTSQARYGAFLTTLKRRAVEANIPGGAYTWRLDAPSLLQSFFIDGIRTSHMFHAPDLNVKAFLSKSLSVHPKTGSFSVESALQTVGYELILNIPDSSHERLALLED